jgi:hypothetical protein
MDRYSLLAGNFALIDRGLVNRYPSISGICTFLSGYCDQAVLGPAGFYCGIQYYIYGPGRIRRPGR